MWRAAALLLLCLATFAVGLGRTAITDSDEAFYAESAREMVDSGDWVTPHYNFEPRLQKPILYYWLVASTYAVTGVTETAARIWAALAGVGLALVAYGVARRWANANVALLAGAIVATCFGFVPIARQALPDVPLAFFVSVAIWAMLEALGFGSATVASRRTWLWLSAVAMGFGVLTKGPIAIVLPLTVVLPLLLLGRSRSTEGDADRRDGGAGATAGAKWLPRGLTPATMAVAGALFTVIAAPWYIAETHAIGLDYIRQFFVGENIDRFATSRYNEWRGWRYVPWIAGGLLPWSAFGLLWMAELRDRLTRRVAVSPAARALLCWTGGPLLLFMASVGSQPRYILPCLVPLVILLARTIVRHVENPARLRGGSILFVAAGAIAGAVVVAAGALFLHARPLLEGINPAWSPMGAWAVMALGGVVVLAALARRRAFVLYALTAAAATTLIVFSTTILSTGRPEAVEVIGAAARANGPAPLICSCGAFARTLNFYSHIKTYVAADDDEEIRQFLANPERVLAAVDAERLARVESSLRRQFPRLAEVTYLNSGVWQQPGTLLKPQLRLLQHVVLISNR